MAILATKIKVNQGSKHHQRFLNIKLPFRFSCGFRHLIVNYLCQFSVRSWNPECLILHRYYSTCIPSSNFFSLLDIIKIETNPCILKVHILNIHVLLFVFIMFILQVNEPKEENLSTLKKSRSSSITKF